MRKLSTNIAGIIAGLTVIPAYAQTQYTSTAYNYQGTKYVLLIQRDGNRLRIDLDATAGATSMSGIPRCSMADLKPDGSFLSYCRGFQTQDQSGYELEGNHERLTPKAGFPIRAGRVQAGPEIGRGFGQQKNGPRVFAEGHRCISTLLICRERRLVERPPR